MQRVILQGDEFKSLQATDLGGYIKLMFHPEGHTDVSILEEGQRPVLRTYTISELDLVNGQIAVDFVKHEVDEKQNHQSRTRWLCDSLGDECKSR